MQYKCKLLQKHDPNWTQVFFMPFYFFYVSNEFKFPFTLINKLYDLPNVKKQKEKKDLILTKHSAASSMCPIWKRCWPAKDLANAFLNASGGRQFWSLYWNCVKITWKIRQNCMTLGETTAIGIYVLAKKQKAPYGIHLSFPIEGKTPMSTTLGSWHSICFKDANF